MLLNETFSDITKFLPNDDITDLMFLSRTFNAFVTPRLKKIDLAQATMNQSIESFMPSPAPETDREWILKLNLKQFEPIGSAAKKRMKAVLKNTKHFEYYFSNMINDAFYGISVRGIGRPTALKEIMSLERFDDATFLRILGALVAMPKFRQKYNISHSTANFVQSCYLRFQMRNFGSYDDVLRIFAFYKYNNDLDNYDSD